MTRGNGGSVPRSPSDPSPPTTRRSAPSCGRLASLGDRIQGNVRRRYPNCRIRVQDTLAASDGELVVYAYREGTILRSTDWGRMLDAREREEQAEAV
jgi:hypothetical protein